MPFKFNPITNKLDLVENGAVPVPEQDFVTDAGTATSVSQVINVVGGTGITTTGVGDTVTITSTASAPDVVLLSSQSLVGVNSVTFNNFIDNTVYMSYNLKLYCQGPLNTACEMVISTDNGVTFLNTGYNNSSGQHNYTNTPNFFNYVNGTNLNFATIGFFGPTAPALSQFNIDLFPFGEPLETRVMVHSSYADTGSPRMVWCNFQHSTTNANAFKIYNVAGTNFTSGRASLYGFKK